MRGWRAGLRNAITDVEGLHVGSAEDRAVRTGVTVLTADRDHEPFMAAVDVRGGAPGTRETDLLAPGSTVERVHALVLSGGSAHGLDAAGGVVNAMRDRGVGFPVGPVRVPIVPAAILFDLLNGERWTKPPWRQLGRGALYAATNDVAIGSVGAGTGATTADARGGLGTASTVLPPMDGLPEGATVGALVAVNAVGSVLADGGPRFLAGAFERDGEFGGLGAPEGLPGYRIKFRGEGQSGGPPPGSATTIGVVATDVTLDRAGCMRLAVAAQDGLARAIWPAHTPLDGDLVFGVSMEAAPKPEGSAMIDLSAAAAECMARAVARGVHAASIEPDGADEVLAWSALFPEQARASR